MGCCPLALISSQDSTRQALPLILFNPGRVGSRQTYGYERFVRTIFRPLGGAGMEDFN